MRPRTLVVPLAVATIASGLGFAPAQALASPGNWVVAQVVREAPVVRGTPAPDPRYPNYAPPPPVAESVAPRPGYIWIGGYHQWLNGRYVWVSGHWEPARTDRRWMPGRWELRGNVYTWIPGSWLVISPTPPAPVAAPAYPPAYPVEPPPPPPAERVRQRHGWIWIDGHYEWHGHRYVWEPGHWERERRGHRWRAGRWDREGGRYIWRPGNWD